MGEGGFVKLASSIAKNMLSPEETPQIVAYIADVNGWKKLDMPTISTALECLYCGGKEHHAPLMSLDKDSQRVWICAEINCETTKLKNLRRAMVIPVTSRRALQWARVCELNGIGDQNLDVKFEDVKQSAGKIEYMLKFANSPRGIIFMQGGPGTGKTYAALAICELFTRTNTSVIFTTQKQMASKWLETFNIDKYNNYIEKVTEIELLVIDDFGTADMTQNFKSFFMDLINTRMQWKNRGTVITTNLSLDDFMGICGEALSDRIQTGQIFEFKEKKSRRTKTIL